MNQVVRTVVRPEVAPGIIRGAKRWHYFMARIQAVRANDKLPKYDGKRRIRVRELVSVNRELLIAGHSIPSGSFGIVMLERVNYGMFDVKFLCAHDICVTLSADDLEAAF